ncbi:T9SS type A sorting domain-containing protein [Hymenobacter aquaticus]|uniref:T9SS type A sorting domain-containing protein n=1 Tax=Hymenobacter aquaticus TaxID=1867101 RepID=A0A4Z0Q7I4_9BACT|nr:T9SS type A sorting domain-containing protein [Hymenobacter aquaticus]TGE26037.1 T9SS type A sorting domain-containing protein [Hymenobacter aquaticus]
MTNWYKTGRTAQPWRKLALAALLAVGGASAAQAQTLNYNLFGAQNVAGTYTDLAATGTVIATANNDDANSAAQPIGFTFNYNGAAFTDFVLNTNGFIKLGTAAPSAANLYYTSPQAATGGPILSTNAADVNLLLPFNHDLVDGTSPAEYRVATTGTAGSRVCTIQWKNVSDKLVAAASGKQHANMQFQLKLYEGTNNIEFVYGPTTAGPGPDAFKYAAVGIKGSGSTATQLITVTKPSVSVWSAATFLAGNYTGNAFNFRVSALPDAGRTLRFRPAAAQDAAVLAVYSLGKLPIPAGAPHTIQAVVRNVGTSALANVSVTASVAGANTFTSNKTIASLAVGASTTVSFDPFTPTNTGNETITVTSGADDASGNNTATYQQVVNATTYAVAEAGPSSGSVGFTNNTTGEAGSGIFAVKYNTSVARTVSAVTVRLEDTRSVGRTVYGVVCDAAGAILSRTPDYVILASDIATTKTFTMPAPVAVAAGSFFAGFAEAVSPAGTAGYFPLGLQTETPTRTGTFYTMALTGGSPVDAFNSGLGRFMIEAVTGAAATCVPPTGVTVTSTSAVSATVTFAGPANGTGYSIVYGPAGFNPATGGTTVTTATSPYTITGLAASTSYDVYIRSNCGATEQSALAGPFSVKTQCSVTSVTTFPYTENFDGVATGTLPCGYTILDANLDAVTWESLSTIGTTPISSSAPNAMVYQYNEDATTAANDWFFTTPLLLRTGNRYQLSFKYRVGIATFPERLEVKYGTSATPAGQTNTLWNNNNVTSTVYATANATSTIPVLPIEPTTTGNYYIGFHVYSLADQFLLAVDDLQITATTITGTSAALDYAINVFPNPSAGIFSVDIKGANAKGAMQLEVMNSLGQIVHTASVRDNQLNKLDLSSLAAGMYVLKVKSGNDFSVRNLSIQK